MRAGLAYDLRRKNRNFSDVMMMGNAEAATEKTSRRMGSIVSKSGVNERLSCLEERVGPFGFISGTLEMDSSFSARSKFRNSDRGGKKPNLDPIRKNGSEPVFLTRGSCGDLPTGCFVA